MNITIATRGSKLALWQANYVKEILEALDSTITCDLNIIKTQGDIILDVSLAKIGGKGLFVKEIEDAMLKGEADIAVHSMKDVPFELPPGLEIAAIMPREDPRDAFVSSKLAHHDELKPGMVVGTSSLRRASQLKKIYKVDTALLRGNVQTRLRKLDEGLYDAIILAAAGLKRLDLEDRIVSSFPADTLIPSPGQGAVGIECRIDDEKMKELLHRIHDPKTTLAVDIERDFNRAIGGSCQVPAGCYVNFHDGRYHMIAFIATTDGETFISRSRSGSIGRRLRSGNSHPRGWTPLRV
jgi:hydroxymethylbilane synthase